MANYVPLTQQEIIRRMRLPEDDPNYVNDPNRALLAPTMIYGGAFMPELGGVARAGQAAKSAIGEIPSYLSSAREALMRSLGYQTPTMRQAAARLVEPGAAEAALPSALTAGQMAGRTALAGTPLIAATAMSPSSEPAIDPAIKTRNGRPVYFTGPSYDINSNDKYDYTLGATPAEVLGSRRATASALDSANIPMPTGGSGRGAAPPSMENYLKDRSSATAANAALDAARARASQTQQRAPIDLTSGQPASSPGILSKIFSGKDYQSNGQTVNTPTGGAPVNWGSSDSAADFFRADKALSQMKAQQAADAMSGATTERRGGSVTGKGQGQSEKMPDPIHKALEIIHHLLIRH